MMFTGISLPQAMTPASAAVPSTETSVFAISPQAFTSTLPMPPRATCAASWPQRCATGMYGPSSSMTASGTRAAFTTVLTVLPDRPAITYSAICVAARVCASRVLAPKCGVKTTLSKRCMGESATGSCSHTSTPAAATLPFSR